MPAERAQRRRHPEAAVAETAEVATAIAADATEEYTDAAAAEGSPPREVAPDADDVVAVVASPTATACERGRLRSASTARRRVVVVHAARPPTVGRIPPQARRVHLSYAEARPRNSVACEHCDRPTRAAVGKDLGEDFAHFHAQNAEKRPQKGR